jgi:hypothetical protein
MKCVSTAVKERRRQGAMTREEGRLAEKHARLSTCAREGLVRCCLYQGPNDDVGFCRVLPFPRCEVVGIGVDALGGSASGSCFPSPCAR